MLAIWTLVLTFVVFTASDSPVTGPIELPTGSRLVSRSRCFQTVPVNWSSEASFRYSGVLAVVV